MFVPSPRLQPGRRVYAVGDVHGQLGRLLALHDLIRLDLAERPAPEPALVHVGDLIDRGPDSAGVVALLAAGPPLTGVPTVNLMGNHEWMLLSALADPASGEAEHWLGSGGTQALESWGIPAATPPARSVSRRSPMPSGDLAPKRSAAWWNIAGSGLPADRGVTPVAEVTAAIIDPLPTIRPRSIGSVVSMLDAR